MDTAEQIIIELQRQAGITRGILVSGLLVMGLILIVMCLLLWANRKDKKSWKIWKDSSAEYFEHMHIVQMAKSYPDGSLNINSSGQIKYVTDRMVEFTGWKKADLKDRSIGVFFSAENLLKVEKFMASHGEVKDRISLETELIKKTGEVVPVELTVSDFESGDQYYTTITIRDIRHRVGHDLHMRVAIENMKRESLLLALGEKILQSGTWNLDMTKDPDVVTYSTGFAKLFDVAVGQTMTSKELMQVVHTDDRPEVNMKVVNAMLRGENYEIHYRVVRRNVRNDLVWCKGEVIFNSNKNPIGINGVIKLVKEDVD